MNLKLTEKYTTAIISTGHVTKETGERMDNQTLNDAAKITWVIPFQYGWLVRLDVLKTVCEECETLEEKLLTLGLKQPEVVNFALLRDNGIDAVHLDCDGPLVEGLETWNW